MPGTANERNTLPTKIGSSPGRAIWSNRTKKIEIRKIYFCVTSNYRRSSLYQAGLSELSFRLRSRKFKRKLNLRTAARTFCAKLCTKTCRHLRFIFRRLRSIGIWVYFRGLTESNPENVNPNSEIAFSGIHAPNFATEKCCTQPLAEISGYP